MYIPNVLWAQWRKLLTRITFFLSGCRLHVMLLLSDSYTNTHCNEFLLNQDFYILVTKFFETIKMHWSPEISK